MILLINYSPFQTYIVGKAADVLSKRLKTRVEVNYVHLGLLNSLEVGGVYLEGQQGDTLLYAGKLQARITDWFIFKKKPVLHYLGLTDAYVHLYRGADSKVWNYDFIADAFGSSGGGGGGNSAFELNLEKVELENVRFHMDDAWIGEDMGYDIGYLLVDADNLDLVKKRLDVAAIEINNTSITIREYHGGRPKHLRPKHIDFDTTAFNTEHWQVTANGVELKNCSFRLEADTDVPVPGQFDEDHLSVSGINISVENLRVANDTIVGNLRNLTAHERCGLSILEMRADVTVSPVASICNHLYMRTNHSVLRDYYAMHYKHFPNFIDYMDSVTMVVNMDDAQVDKRDVQFFAPQLEDFPQVTLSISGEGRGTVADLQAKNLVVKEGNATLKGDLAMRGLPDIYSTLITFTNGELSTSGKGILKFAPSLKNNPDLAMDSVKVLTYKGTYEGYIENFKINGVFTSNLGTVSTALKMYIPNFNVDSAQYIGAVTADKLALGKLLNQPILGSLSLDETVSGSSFNPENMQLYVEGKVTELGLNDYLYHNIYTKGTLAKKQFDGELLIDDPNLAMGFNGRFNYADKLVKVAATAHLLHADFKAMNLIGDNLTASADFDLDCTGSNIDDFNGYAKLFNIDLKRGPHLLDIDSVYLRSTGGGVDRKLNITSDAFTVGITGDYRLSKLPASFQYYLSRYIPNYIKPPSTEAPEQDITFSIATREVDSIFAVTVPIVRGFDHALITGKLNTKAGKLALNAQIPYGSVGGMLMSDIEVIGDGDMNKLSITTDIDNVIFGDSALNGELSLKATVGNDSVRFKLSTLSPDRENSFVLNGGIVARNDTLSLSVLPSKFSFSRDQWEIAGGSKVVYAEKYLSVQGVSLTSGIQKISSYSTNGRIYLNAEQIDIAKLGGLLGLSAYQPDGRISGTVYVDNILTDMVVNANIRATDVKLATDTIGTIHAVGYYDDKKQLIHIDPQTGIYREFASVAASGDYYLDSTVANRLSGQIKFVYANIAWAAPFLEGLFSNLGGTVHGLVSVGWRNGKPDIDGKLQLRNAAMKLDYLGCTYTIPDATVTVTDKRIDMGNITIYDVYKNKATLSGYFSHDVFDKMRMRLKVTTKKMEVLNLGRNDNDLFYGHLFASMDSFTIRGPFNNIRLNLYNGEPAAKSVVYIPASTGGYTGGYSYATFKTYGTSIVPQVRKSNDKISINLDANMNSLAEFHVVLDPATEDEIIATGSGNITMDIPPNNDLRMTGMYTINEGLYKLTFPQFYISRQFKLLAGSTINFNGPFSATNLAVNAIYAAKARTFDLLTENERILIKDNRSELIEAQTPQWVNVILHMNGPIYTSKLTFDIDLESKQSQASYAYRKLVLLNNDDRQKFEQVAALLLVNSFIPMEGGGLAASARSGAANNFSQLASSTVSQGLQKIVNKLLGDRDLNVSVKYNNYNYGEQASVSSVNRNQLKLGVTKNYLNDRLLVSVGSTSDWGRPVAANSSSSTFNLAGDFRVQYQLSNNSGLRLNVFHNSDYDLTLDRNIQRSGVGLSWRKSFDNLAEFFGGVKYMNKLKKQQEQDTASIQLIDTLTVRD